ncbi:hypothetical protein [Rhodobacter maris]|uniref:Lipoprotein n=1 Tax=Rhodobacter maris TaxID=446682 RepID=A0A285SVJ5_9RHOB|nr:hypothetical protein [Rhodobacter maris]SOC10481.1 hypothetical protein SAMN05877831_10874 [Rhodobacter maris]
MTLIRRSVPLPLLLATSLALTGCGWMNPFNWFRHQEVAQTLAPPGGYPDIENDKRRLIADVVGLEVKPSQGGAIVAATGLPPTQGWWGTALLAENDGEPVEGEMRYRFVAVWPEPGSLAAQRVGTPNSREVTATAYINSVKLARVKRIVVIGATNQRAISR